MLRRTTSLVLWLVIFEFFVVGAHGEADAGTAIVPETLTTAEATASIDVTASPDTTPSEDITDSIEFAGEAGQSVEATTNSRKVPKARPAPQTSSTSKSSAASKKARSPKPPKAPKAPIALESGYNPEELYRKVQTVNTSECVEKVAALPLKVFEFKYDSVAGRRQLGVIGRELESVLPESVEVVKSQAFKNPDPDGPPLVKLSNFPVVDKSVLFMYGVGAVQNLIERQKELDLEIERLEEMEKKARNEMDEIIKLMNQEVEDQVVERRLKLEVEVETLLLKQHLDDVKHEEELAALEKQGESERRMVSFEDELAQERLKLEDERERNRTFHRVKLEAQEAILAEEQRRDTEIMLKEKQLEQDQELEVERRKAELERVAAEAKAKAEAERVNEDVNLRAIEARGNEERKRLLQAITAVLEHIGRGGVALLANPRQLMTLLGSIIAILAGGFVAREAAILARQILEAKLGRPRLVRETSRTRILILSPVRLFKFIVQVSCFPVTIPLYVITRFYKLIKWLVTKKKMIKKRVRRRKQPIIPVATPVTPVQTAKRAEIEKSGDSKSKGSSSSSPNKKGGGKKNKNNKSGEEEKKRLAEDKAKAKEKKSDRKDDEEYEWVEIEVEEVSDSAVKLARQKRVDMICKNFDGVVLSEQLTERVQQLAVATANAKRNGMPFRHLLLYGPPGTGKTMVARRLARASGMDYAVMSGGDVGPLGKDAVTELHALFRWARNSTKGLLLFIDEAEAFLGSRSRTALSEELRNALNALLYQTGTQSYSFMMVLATNRAEDLDSAVLDRMDESLYFPLPTEPLRASLASLYFNEYVTSCTETTRRAKESRFNPRRGLRRLLGPDSLLANLGLSPPIIVKFDNDKKTVFNSIAKTLDGFSGREIAKVMIAVQSAAYGSENNQMDEALLSRLIDSKCGEHNRKIEMIAEGSVWRAATGTASSPSPATPGVPGKEV